MYSMDHINFMTTSNKKWGVININVCHLLITALGEMLFRQLGCYLSGYCHCGEVKIRVLHRLFIGTKKAAIVERWPLMEVQVYVYL